MIDAHKDALGRARNNFLSKKAEEGNLRSRLKNKAPEGASQAEKTTFAESTEEFLEFERSLKRLEAIYGFQKDKMEVLNKEYLAQYLELKDNAEVVRKQL